MKTQNNIKYLFFSILLLFLLIILTLTLMFVKRESDINDSHNINSLRAYTATVVNIVNSDFPNIDNLELEESLDNIESTALLVDLDSNVIFNNSSLETNDVTHDMYQDSSYSLLNEEMIKVSFLVGSNDSIQGIIIFEVPKALIASSDFTLWYVVLIIEIISLLSLLIYTRISFNKVIIDPINKLNEALLDVSKGVYNKINPGKRTPIKSFTNYNIMLENMENTLSNQANYAKSRKQLIANISHEVRTPLSYVKMSAEMLSKDSSINSENQKHITTILSKTSQIDNIIEDLFRYSRQDLDKLLVELKETYIKDMFDRIFENLKCKDDTKDITINISNNIPNIIFNIDENRFVQVISNIVDNAEKHIMDKGYINIRTDIEENHLIVVIEDSGEGIKPKDLPYIFEPFYQGEQDAETKRKGAGLGLAICDYIVRKHNGEIYVYSDEGKGARFVIKLGEIK